MRESFESPGLARPGIQTTGKQFTIETDEDRQIVLDAFKHSFGLDRCRLVIAYLIEEMPRILECTCFSIANELGFARESVNRAFLYAGYKWDYKKNIRIKLEGMNGKESGEQGQCVCPEDVRTGSVCADESEQGVAVIREDAGGGVNQRL